MSLVPFVYFIITLLVFLLTPDAAYAWGPGMHAYIAMGVLSKAMLAAPAIRLLMEKFPDDFLYGAASPDIMVGKKYAGLLHHCHNWRIGWLILSEARTERQRAAAYGYLMHLAADVVAHNYFIPFKIIKSYKARVLSHTYWEMRFDIGVPDKVWKMIDRVSAYEIEEFDSLLDRVLRKTLFSFRVSKRIFSTILILQKTRGLRKSLGLYAKKSSLKMEEESRKEYINLTMDSALDFLAHPKDAKSLNIDPTGLVRLNWAKSLRKNIRNLVSRGMMNERSANKLIFIAKEKLEKGLYHPNISLPDVSDVL